MKEAPSMAYGVSDGVFAREQRAEGRKVVGERSDIPSAVERWAGV